MSERAVYERAVYEQIKANILEAVEEMREADGDAAADYLLEHLCMDDERMTFMYDGEPGRLEIRKVTK